jgi:hypothetical protein
MGTTMNTPGERDPFDGLPTGRELGLQREEREQIGESRDGPWIDEEEVDEEEFTEEHRTGTRDDE